MMYPKLTNTKYIQISFTGLSHKEILYTITNTSICVKNNMKSSRKLIGTLIHRKTKGQSDPTEIIVNNQIYTTNSDIVKQRNKYFVNPLTPKISLELLLVICLTSRKMPIVLGTFACSSEKIIDP